MMHSESYHSVDIFRLKSVVHGVSERAAMDYHDRLLLAICKAGGWVLSAIAT
jgi:hypothetical protein